MEQLVFPPNKSVEISFKVAIAGTSALPQSVSVVLKKDHTALAFAATKDNDLWKAVIERPGMIFGEGDVIISVEVVINNRLFAPFKSTALIAYDAAPIDVPVKDAEIEVIQTVPSNEAPPEIEVASNTPSFALELPIKKAVESADAAPKKKQTSLLKLLEPTTEGIVKNAKPLVKDAPKQEELTPVVEKVVKKIIDKDDVRKLLGETKAVSKVNEQVNILKTIEPVSMAQPPKPAVEAVVVQPQAQPFKLTRKNIVTI